MKIIAVDFDGTLCENAYPDVGEARIDVIRRLQYEIQDGAKVILWTCRTGKPLKEAVGWCRLYGIEFDAINESLPETIEKYGTDPRKIGADEYWDDRAMRI